MKHRYDHDDMPPVPAWQFGIALALVIAGLCSFIAWLLGLW